MSHPHILESQLNSIFGIKNHHHINFNINRTNSNKKQEGEQLLLNIYFCCPRDLLTASGVRVRVRVTEENEGQ